MKLPIKNWLPLAPQIWNEFTCFGFALLERHWGRGYAEEIARAVLAHARQVLRLPRIVAITAPDNARSGRLLARLGFAFERTVRLPGATQDSRFFVHRGDGLTRVDGI